MIKEVTQYILSKSEMSDFTLGENFFAGHLPLKNKNNVEPPVRSVVLLERTPSAVEPDLPDRVDKAIQVWNRGGSYFEAHADAHLIYSILHGSVQWDLPLIVSGDEYTAMIINAVAAPAILENPDDRSKFVFSTNYIFMIMEKNA